MSQAPAALTVRLPAAPADTSLHPTGTLQHKRTCRRLLKHLPMIDNGEVEVDSLLVHNTEVIYKCSAVGGTGCSGQAEQRNCLYTRRCRTFAYMVST